MARRRSTLRKGAAVSPHAQAVTQTPADAAAEAHVPVGWLTLNGVKVAAPQELRIGRTLLYVSHQPIEAFSQSLHL